MKTSPPPPPVAQLAAEDSIFLAMEDAGIPSHFGGLAILTPSLVEGFSFDRFRLLVEERIAVAPRMAARVHRVPFGADHPYLWDDGSLDVSAHLKRIAVPAPGGMRELTDLVGELHRRPLDPTRPLWEVWVIEGLAGDRVALLMKAHHCLMGAGESSGLGALLCDTEAKPPPRPWPEPHRGRTEMFTPSRLELLSRSLANLIPGTEDLARVAAPLRELGGQIVRTWNGAGEADEGPRSAPATTFNRTIGPRRTVACAIVPMEDLDAVAGHHEVTRGDVILAMIGSAVRDYLRERDRLPERSLRVLVPTTMREPAGADVDDVAHLTIDWATDVAEPVERLRRIHEATVRARRESSTGGIEVLSALGSLVPPALAQLSLRALGVVAGAGVLPANVVVSNVVLPTAPLYCAGARIDAVYPLSVLLPGQGLNVTTMRYGDNLHVGVTTDPDLVPDPWALALGIETALGVLRDSTGRVGRADLRRMAAGA